MATDTTTLANKSQDFKGTTIASATTTDLNTATGDYVTISGTTTITALGTCSAGIQIRCLFSGALTLTHNATSLILPGGANITTAAGDSALFISEGSGNWRCVDYRVAVNTPSSGGNSSIAGTYTAANATATTSGGSTVAGLKMGTGAIGVYFGSGAPTITAAKGSLYLASDGSSTSTRLFINSSGSTTWVAITTAS